MWLLLAFLAVSCAARSFDVAMCLRASASETGTTVSILESEASVAYRNYPFSCEGSCPCKCPSVIVPARFTAVRTRSDANNVNIVIRPEEPERRYVYAVVWGDRARETYNVEGKESFFISHAYTAGLGASPVAVVAQSLCRADFRVDV